MRPKVLPIILPPDTYRRLELEGRAQERDPVQQARWIIRQALSEPPGAPPTADRPLTTAAPSGRARRPDPKTPA